MRQAWGERWGKLLGGPAGGRWPLVRAVGWAWVALAFLLASQVVYQFGPWGLLSVASSSWGLALMLAAPFLALALWAGLRALLWAWAALDRRARAMPLADTPRALAWRVSLAAALAGASVLGLAAASLGMVQVVRSEGRPLVVAELEGHALPFWRWVRQELEASSQLRLAHLRARLARGPLPVAELVAQEALPWACRWDGAARLELAWREGLRLHHGQVRVPAEGKKDSRLGMALFRQELALSRGPLLAAEGRHLRSKLASQAWNAKGRWVAGAGGQLACCLPDGQGGWWLLGEEPWPFLPRLRVNSPGAPSEVLLAVLPRWVRLPEWDLGDQGMPAPWPRLGWAHVGVGPMWWVPPSSRRLAGPWGGGWPAVGLMPVGFDALLAATFRLLALFLASALLLLSALWSLAVQWRRAALMGAAQYASSSLAAALAHELRTPMATMRLDAELLASHPELPAGLGASAARLVQEGTRLDARLEEAIAIGRMGHGGRQRTEPYDPQALADAAVEEAQGRLAGLELRRVGQPPEGPWYGDGGTLQRALVELLVNAAKHGQGPLELELLPEGWAVRDHGPALPPEALAQAFRPFERLGAEGPGSGLGLALVSTAAVLHGGRAWAELPPGGGLRVVLQVRPEG